MSGVEREDGAPSARSPEGRAAGADAAADRGRFVRTGASKDAGARYTLAHAFACAGQGVLATIKRERNMKIHCAAAVFAIVAALAVRAPLWGVAAVVVCIGVVMALECVNTAVEAVVDLVSPEWHELAKLAKDAAAGATLIAAAMSVVVAMLVYLPAIVCLLGW